MAHSGVLESTNLYQKPPRPAPINDKNPCKRRRGSAIRNKVPITNIQLAESPSQVIRAAEDDEDGEKKQPAADDQGNHPGGIFHVHEEQDDQRCFGEGNQQGDYGIQDAKILECDPGGEAGKDKQSDPDDYVYLR
jgi:hypothetical protein